MRLCDSNLAAVDDRELTRRSRGGDVAARTALIERYLPLARLLAFRHRRPTEPIDDLVQVASVGLLKAVDRWEPERGLAFSTYAVPTIRGELRHYLRDATWLVRPTRDVIELAATIEQKRDSLRATIGREPARADFAERLGRSPEQVARALATADHRWGFSLDHEVPDDADHTAVTGDQIGSEDGEYGLVEARLAFDALTDGLDEEAREVLRLRFVDDLLQVEIAQRLGCSQIQVSRIVRASLESLRHQAPGCTDLAA